MSAIQNMGRLAVVMASLLVACPAFGDTLDFNLNASFAGVSTPGGNWLEAKFSSAAAGSVSLALTAPNLPAGSFVSKWYFDFDPALDLDLLDPLVGVPTLSGVSGVTFAKSLNDLQADGDGKYDIRYDFPTSAGGGSDRFENGDSATIGLSSTESIVAQSFNFISAPGGGHGPFYVAAHIQGLSVAMAESLGGDKGSDSIWITISAVPEPATAITLFTMAAAAAWGVVRGRRKATG